MKKTDILATKGFKVITIRPQQTIKEDVDLMEKHNIDGLVVVGQKENIVGVLQDEIDAVAHTMTEKGFRHLSVAEVGKLVGIFTIGDVVKAQRDRYQGELHTLQIQMTSEKV